MIAKIQNKPYLKSIYVGFAVLYFTSMLFSTYLVKGKFEEEFLGNLETKAASISNMISNEYMRAGWDSSNITEEQKNYMRSVICGIASFSDTKYQQISGAIYDQTGRLVGKSENYMGITQVYEPDEGEIQYPFVALSEYFSMDELQEIAEMTEKYVLPGMSVTEPQKYMFFSAVEEDTYQLLSLQMEKITWEKVEGDMVSFENNESPRKMALPANDGHYVSVGSEILWKWENPEADGNEKSMENRCEFYEGMPGLAWGLRYWEKWQENEYLQSFAEIIDASYTEDGGYSELISSETEADLTYPVTFDKYYGTDRYILKLRTVTHPWLAAMDDMKVVYLGGFVLMLACMLKVIYMTEKTYRQQAAMEESHRVFTNAIAHELKTPLSVIRGFAENLKENVKEDKREYYLEQIVGQTEVMDDLVQEMIYASKMDSEKLELNRDFLDMLQLVEEQMEKLETLVDEKNLQVTYDIKENFFVMGDKSYLEKAMWNLLANAVEYNYQDGKIAIIFTSDSCVIENTGNAIPEQELPKVYDMFYTGEKSRTSGKRHLGMGLYLSRKILEKHHLKLEIENIPTGIKATISFS